MSIIALGSCIKHYFQSQFAATFRAPRTDKYLKTFVVTNYEVLADRFIQLGLLLCQC